MAEHCNRAANKRITDIVLVEDSEDEVYLTKILFKRYNINLNIRHYFYFADLYNQLRDDNVDGIARSIIAIDLNLKLSSGIDAVKTLRSLECTTESIVGVVSGSVDPADKIEAFNAGAEYFLPKPLNVDAIKSMCLSVDNLILDCSTSGVYSIYTH